MTEHEFYQLAKDMMPTRIAFSTHYPDRMGELAGKPTYFHHKIASGLGIKSLLGSCNPMYLHPKTTTIRKNYDYWKAKEGQLLQPFFWAGKPYRSKQVVFCPEVRLKKVKKIHITKYVYFTDIDLGALKPYEERRLIENEVFDHPDHFWMWFDRDFSGALLELENAKL